MIGDCGLRTTPQGHGHGHFGARLGQVCCGKDARVTRYDQMIPGSTGQTRGRCTRWLDTEYVAVIEGAILCSLSHHPETHGPDIQSWAMARAHEWRGSAALVTKQGDKLGQCTPLTSGRGAGEIRTHRCDLLARTPRPLDRTPPAKVTVPYRTVPYRHRITVPRIL